MSYHVQLTPDAARKLRQQRANSTILSLIISILIIVLMAIALGLFLIQGLTLKPPPMTTWIAAPRITPQSDRPPTTTSSFQRNPSAPSQSASKVLLSNSSSPVSLPNPETAVELSTSDFGNGDDFGASFGNGKGNSFAPIPTGSRQRCNKTDRLQRLNENGGNESCEDSVLKALRWLQKNQNSDGSWGREKPVAMTGLALLAYLGHCETPTSREFGATVTDGMLFLANNSLQQNGKCATDLRDKHWCYEHAIAVYALSESFIFSKSLNIAPQLEEAVKSGTQWILDNQTKAGGWDYAYSTDGRPGDSSIVAWHLQALKAASSTGLNFPKIKKTISRGLQFLDTCQNDNGGFGYGTNRRPVGSANGHFTLTGAGALCFQQHKGVANSNARKGVRYLSENSTFNFATSQANLYEHYYSSQAMINHGSQAWSAYNGMIRDELLNNQNEDGSWPNPGGPGNHKDPVYATALGTLILEVYYRYLPGTSAKS